MNGFLDLAERQIPAPVKTRHQIAVKRAALSAHVKRERSERDYQLRTWRRWRRERLDAVLAGPHGEAARTLIGFLKAITVHDAPALVEFVHRAALHRADSDTRFEILALIDAHIIKLREAHGLAPFDDGLNDEAPTAFQQIPEMLR